MTVMGLCLRGFSELTIHVLYRLKRAGERMKRRVLPIVWSGFIVLVNVSVAAGIALYEISGRTLYTTKHKHGQENKD